LRAPSATVSVRTASCAGGRAQLLLESLREPDDLFLIGFDDEVRYFAIDRIAKCVQLGQARQWIGGLQQRAVLAAAGAVPERLRRRMQVQDAAILLQAHAILAAHDRAAT